MLEPGSALCGSQPRLSGIYAQLHSDSMFHQAHARGMIKTPVPASRSVGYVYVYVMFKLFVEGQGDAALVEMHRAPSHDQ